MTQALILVGGQGTRLRPLTCNTPKSMVPVLNIPFLEHVIRNLKAHNILEIILAQHHLAASMAHYFGDGSRFGVRFHYVMEDSPRGTAGAVKNAERFLNGTFFVLNGDIFQNRDFTDMLAFHRHRKAKVTISLTPVEDPTIYGVVETDEQGRVRRFLEKPKAEDVTTNLINAGTYILEADVLRRVPQNIKYSFEHELFPGMLHDGEPVYAYSSQNYWMDTGTPEKYLQLHRDLLAGRCDGYTFNKDIITGKNSKIHFTARLNGRIVIGENCVLESGVKLLGPLVIGSHCHIGREAIIANSVLWNNINVGTQASLQSCAIANDCIIGNDARLEKVVLGDRVVIPDASSLEPGSRVFPPD
jgi:mannose-1-phosphate guanylyltransferase